MTKYIIPWQGMLPVIGMTLFMSTVNPMLNWYNRTFVTEGQPKRRAMDYFDHVMAERDEKITGSMYRQQAHPFAKS